VAAWILTLLWSAPARAQCTCPKVSFAAARTFDTSIRPTSVVTGDFNGDGRPDVAVANENGNYVSVLLGNGNGTLQTAVNYGTGSSPQAVVSADFDGNGTLDLAVVNGGANNVTILLGSGSGTFTSAGTTSVGTSPKAIAAADLNADGRPTSWWPTQRPTT
jgi:hypothetical protein